jgi:hypothetical protein
MRDAIVTTILTVIVLGITPFATAGTWTTLDRPGASNTWAYGIDGSNIVGGSSTGSFLYDGSTWTTIDTYNYAYDIDGSNIVVNSGDLGSYLYNVTSSTRTYLHMPGAYSTSAYGIDGNNVVGYMTGQTGTSSMICLGYTMAYGRMVSMAAILSAAIATAPAGTVFSMMGRTGLLSICQGQMAQQRMVLMVIIL